MSMIHLLPQPVEIIPGDGCVRLPRTVQIVLPAAADDANLYASDCLQEYLGLTGVCGSREKRYAHDFPGFAITLMRADRDADWLPNHFTVLKPQGYHLSITSDGILLIGADAPGLFYAVQTMRQILDQAGRKLPLLTITDHPAIPVRGVMLDVSRMKMPTVETMLEVIDHLAAWKINQFQLYIEHTFHFPSHPKIGQGYDPLTADDILTIDEACAQRHIEFVPNLQSFGHQRGMLNLPEYYPLAESADRWTLSPAEPGAYQLFDDLYREFLPNFRSKLFNVDSDETYDLGKGKSAGMVAEIGLGRVYLNHILRLRELASKYDRRIMFWGDIILHHPELIADIPDDVIVLQWDYEQEPSEENVRKFAEAGKQFYVCPGVNTWTAFMPRQRQARGNIRRMAEYGMKYGALGLLNTDWGDYGHFNLQGLSYYGYAFGAAESWLPGSTAAFDAAFGRLFFGKDGDAVMEAQRLFEEIEAPMVGRYHLRDVFVFHTSFLCGTAYRETFTTDITTEMKSNAEKGVQQLKKLRKRTRQSLVIEELLLAAEQDLLYAEKADLAVNFHRRYADIAARNAVDEFEELVREVRPCMRRIAGAAAKIPKRFAPLWRARAREAGLKYNMDYQLEVARGLQDDAKWLHQAVKTAKCTGMVPSLPEKNDTWISKQWKL